MRLARRALYAVACVLTLFAGYALGTVASAALHSLFI